MFYVFNLSRNLSFYYLFLPIIVDPKLIQNGEQRSLDLDFREIVWTIVIFVCNKHQISMAYIITLWTIVKLAVLHNVITHYFSSLLFFSWSFFVKTKIYPSLYLVEIRMNVEILMHGKLNVKVVFVMVWRNLCFGL